MSYPEGLQEIAKKQALNFKSVWAEQTADAQPAVNSDPIDWSTPSPSTPEWLTTPVEKVDEKLTTIPETQQPTTVPAVEKPRDIIAFYASQTRIRIPRTENREPWYAPFHTGEQAEVVQKQWEKQKQAEPNILTGQNVPAIDDETFSLAMLAGISYSEAERITQEFNAHNSTEIINPEGVIYAGPEVSNDSYVKKLIELNQLSGQFKAYRNKPEIDK